MDAARRGGTAKADTRGNIRKAHLWRKARRQSRRAFCLWGLPTRRPHEKAARFLTSLGTYRSQRAPGRRACVSRNHPESCFTCPCTKGRGRENSNDYFVFGSPRATLRRIARGASTARHPPLCGRGAGWLQLYSHTSREYGYIGLVALGGATKAVAVWMNRRQCFTSGILAVVIMGSVAASQVWTPTRPATETMWRQGGGRAATWGRTDAARTGGTATRGSRGNPPQGALAGKPAGEPGGLFLYLMRMPGTAPVSGESR